MNVTVMLKEIRKRARLSHTSLAHILGTSPLSLNRWERGVSTPTPAQVERIQFLHQSTKKTSESESSDTSSRIFLSHGVRRKTPLFDSPHSKLELSKSIFPPILNRITNKRFFAVEGQILLNEILEANSMPAITAQAPPDVDMSAGKNTYTYDAHTYHTKVPPQGILELLNYYLPAGGLILDPFAGSGMTGVAARVKGSDCILNELSPAACFIANRFTTSIDSHVFTVGINTILDELQELRKLLYTTSCRECGQPTEILYTVWSYSVLCNHCDGEFLLWDHCRSYGRTVREHKILKSFPCPFCNYILNKSRLQRTTAKPVQLGYKCCGSRQQEVTHKLDADDLERINKIESLSLEEGFYPTMPLADGVNLRQPAKHGFNSVDKFYTRRNLIGMSHLWKTIHRVESKDIAAHLAFVFTSLYQRVTRFSEFRFWGGSGNTARFNVPYIFNEANVFVTFSRKALSIQDHLKATASHYGGKSLVIQNSATSLDYLPDASVDLIFTDPPFGANINYSEMNIIWESWLGTFTDISAEAIINKVQKKRVIEYQQIMTQCLKECYRVLRPGHWLLVVFMNSSHEVWAALKTAIMNAAFVIEKISMFDKQHGTFKQFVSDNTAGYDLVLHCRKPEKAGQRDKESESLTLTESIFHFLAQTDLKLFRNIYLHVNRKEELDFRKLYSEWLSQSLLQERELIDFSQFRSVVKDYVDKKGFDINYL